ncbi:aceric acid hydrolase [Rhodopirellula bahusiensis]|uniref:aceric acid hydrolase n=1 Tax=Rhodopirellula bahusiensis TaxID=2014065 RepID=UPI003263FE1D
MGKELVSDRNIRKQQTCFQLVTTVGNGQCIMRLAFNILAIYVGVWLFACNATAQPIASPSFRSVEPIAIGEVNWTDGFWAQRLESCRRKTIPAMWEIMRGTQYKPYLEHFRIAAGLSEGRYRGASFNDGDFYKWIEAVCLLQAVDKDHVWDQRLDEIITIIGKAQRSDGYLHTPVLIANRNGDDSAQPFGDRFNFEMYNMGHLMTAACVHHQVTGKNSLLRIAQRAADFLDDAYRNPTPEQAGHAICPSHYMGLLDLYRTTGESRYLDLAKRLVEMRDLTMDGGDDNQDRIPFTQQTEAVGHAVRATYLYAGIADLYAETGDKALWSSLATIWRNVVDKKMYITGGCGALHDGASPEGSRNQREITRVHQAFGRNYQLPNATAHNETCANIGNVLWNWRMFLASGEAKHIDTLELALYNSVLSGVDLNGTNFFYTNPLRQSNAAPVALRWAGGRKPFVTSFCCPPNLARTIAGVGQYAYGKSGDTVWVNLYGSNTLDTKLIDSGHVRIEQTTGYPWDGRIQITIAECQNQPVCLKLRIPGWTTIATVNIDGVPTDAKIEPGSYVSLIRVWSPGTVIELDFAMPARLIESHPLVEETRNHVAIKRGPVVYCLESVDLPNNTSLAAIRVPEDVSLNPRFDPELLGGVTVLGGVLNRREDDEWGDHLYREFNSATTVPVTLQLIPYFAWGNRGNSEMSVWLPLD